MSWLIALFFSLWELASGFAVVALVLLFGSLFDAPIAPVYRWFVRGLGLWCVAFGWLAVAFGWLAREQVDKIFVGYGDLFAAGAALVGGFFALAGLRLFALRRWPVAPALVLCALAVLPAIYLATLGVVELLAFFGAITVALSVAFLRRDALTDGF